MLVSSFDDGYTIIWHTFVRVVGEKGIVLNDWCLLKLATTAATDHRVVIPLLRANDAKILHDIPEYQ